MDAEGDFRPEDDGTEERRMVFLFRTAVFLFVVACIVGSLYVVKKIVHDDPRKMVDTNGTFGYDNYSMSKDEIETNLNDLPMYAALASLPPMIVFGFIATVVNNGILDNKFKTGMSLLSIPMLSIYVWSWFDIKQLYEDKEVSEKYDVSFGKSLPATMTLALVTLIASGYLLSGTYRGSQALFVMMQARNAPADVLFEDPEVIDEYYYG